MTATTLTLTQGAQDPVTMPRLGLGVWTIPAGAPTRKSVLWALDAGIRLIDTAASYHNEESVGEALRESGVPRDDVFVTTKLQYTRAGYEGTKREFRASLDRLGLDHVDLYLVHAPPYAEEREGTWKAMEELVDAGLCRAVGVSNYGVHHLDAMRGYADRMPAMNQIELHPWLTQDPIVSRSRDLGAHVTAYSPLTQGHLLERKQVTKMAAKYDRTAAQVLIRWSLQRGHVCIPRSTKEAHVRENASVWDFELADEDLAAMDAWNEDRHISWDPTTWP